MERDVDRDRFMSADEARSYGIIDHVISAAKPVEVAK
ncbi:MAG TPA: ATP-dependent Clp protease proteolytic subunit [Gemmatimonadaceae bacterium]|nr:ATP-dependent Clp protease proteolytic subunit [Gemmatimonadaceae bacterium]